MIAMAFIIGILIGAALMLAAGLAASAGMVPPSPFELPQDEDESYGVTDG